MSDGELAFTSFERALRINTINRSALAREGTIHPTQKSIDLYAWILKNYAKQGDKIFDPFLGSGSSRIAAFKKGFDFYACELDKEYFDAQEERLQKECFGVEKLANGKTIIQQSLF
jgi:site-specific DNA-methyltransferase (adenine-specific)